MGELTVQYKVGSVIYWIAVLHYFRDVTIFHNDPIFLNDASGSLPPLRGFTDLKRFGDLCTFQPHVACTALEGEIGLQS